jgi:Tol biopolymer transport system component
MKFVALAICFVWPAIGAAAEDRSLVSPSERTSYRDEVTGVEVWRLTSHPEVDIATHRLRNCWSPDGSMILFRSEREGILHLFVMPANGSKITRLDDLKGSAKYGVWSRTGREVICTRAMHKTGFEIHAINVETLAGRRIIGPFEDQLGPMSVSPDGQSILFTRFIQQPEGEKQDVIRSSFVNMDGTDFFTFEKISKHGSFSWIPGRMDLLRMKSSRQQYIAQRDGSGLRLLAEGGHEWFTPDGRELLVCDPGGGDPSKWLGKCSVGIYDVATGRRRDLTNELVWIGTHPSISPDGRLVAVDNASHSYPGAILIVSTDGSDPVRVLCYHHASWESGHITHPTMHWSPDGTKIVFVSDKDSEDKKKGDLYLAVVAQPEAPTQVHIQNRAAGPLVTWRPAKRHTETKEYVIMRSVPSPRLDRLGRKLDRTGVFEEVGVVPVVSAHLEGEQIDAEATTLTVHTTEGFPERGQLLIAGNHSMAAPELVSYTGKTGTRFLNCTRGANDTKAALHWTGARVWSLSGLRFTDKLPSSDRQYYYTVLAREHSGLQSPYSRISNAAFVK